MGSTIAEFWHNPSDRCSSLRVRSQGPSCRTPKPISAFSTLQPVPMQRKASARGWRTRKREGLGGEGVFRRVRSQEWHTSLTSFPAPSAPCAPVPGNRRRAFRCRPEVDRGLREAVLSLEEQPNRCPLTAEND